MTTNTKLALAMAVPAVALFAGAMMLHGPGAWLEGARSRERRRKGPRGGLGYTPERHTDLAEEKRRSAVELMSKSSQSLTQKKCHMAVLQVAKAQRLAGEAYAHAEDHVPDRHSFRRLEEDLGRMTMTVANSCRGYTL